MTQQSRLSRARAVISACSLALLAAAVTVTMTGCPAKPDPLQAGTNIDLRRYYVELDERDREYALGGEQPLVTIVLWTDYACPPCGRTWQVMKHLVEDYGDDIRVVFRAGTVPGFQHGERATEAALAAGAQGKFWEMHWRLFENPEDFSRPVLRKHAEVIGLDVNQFMDDLDTGAYSGDRVRDRRRATELGLSALPAGFVNGLFVLGFKEEAGWHALIDRELASARRMMQEGIKREAVYAEFMATAKHGQVTEDGPAGQGSAEAEAERLMAERKAMAEAAKAPQTEGPKHDQRYAIPTGAPGYGPADAPVVLVEFIDYQCPYCRKAHEEIVPALIERYGDDLRVELRHLPLEIHAGAAPAARAVITASRQGKATEFHEALWKLDGGGLGFSTFVRLADELGMDKEAFERDFQTREVSDALVADLLLARRLGVRGTPGFFVNGRFVDGARSVGTFEGLIDEELERAKALAEQGTARADLNAELMRGALGPEQYPNAHIQMTSNAAGQLGQL